MRFLTPFTYYGGKSKLVKHYPAPRYPLIIEPFAGSAAYSWNHRLLPNGLHRDIWLNDLDPRTASIWLFLLHRGARNLVREWVPEHVIPGLKVSDLLPDGVKEEFPGLLELLRAEANQGTQGANGVHDQVTTMGAKCWKVRKKLEIVIPEVVNWQITQENYADLPNMEATWFIDPPYNNPAGKRYRQSSIDYGHLAEWCKTRKGQVIVCENEGANWLPFTPIDHKRVSIRGRYQQANAKEVVWLNEGGK